ncbi:PilZ domain-containing protein [Fibrobacterota bacterium]
MEEKENIKYLLARIILLVSGLAISLPADDSVYDNIRKAFPSASPILIILLGSLAIFILGFFVAWEILKSDKQRREKIELSWQNFGELVSKRGLTPKETKLLKNIVEAGKQLQADTIFNSPTVYEESLDAYLNTLEKKDSSELMPYDLLSRLRKKLNYSRLPVETHLTSTKQLNPGMPVTIGNRKSDMSIKATIKEIDERVWSLEGKDLPIGQINQNQSLPVWFIRPGDAEYRLKIRVKEIRDGSIVLEHTHDLQRKQLRNWVRVDVNIPCKATLVKKTGGKDESPDKDDLPNGTVLEGRIMDISGGGICLRLSSGLSSGSTLSLNFDLPGSSLKNILSEVINYDALKKNDANVFIHRLKFCEIETATQEKIVRFVFEKNRMDSQFR